MASYDILVPNPSRVELRYIANDSVSPHQNPPIPYDAIEMFENKLKNAGDACIIPGGKEWVLDLDRLKKNFPRFLRWIGLRGEFHWNPRQKCMKKGKAMNTDEIT